VEPFTIGSYGQKKSLKRPKQKHGNVQVIKYYFNEGHKEYTRNIMIILFESALPP
jgi:hypothetical protein